MLLQLRATAPIQDSTQKILITFDAGLLRSIPIPVPTSAPVTWDKIDTQQVQLSACTTFDCFMEVEEGVNPKLRIRIQTGERCDLTVMINNNNFATVGANADQTFVLTC
jgi:hypothetical protein